ncbi:MAG TPA: hypothetical protein VNM72_08470 [Blastocatellia bacterium]|nr:hypothetical protein [Blastocatellia bacterium]
MIRGYVNADDEAVIEVEIIGSGLIEAVIDTGFSGFLVLPRTHPYSSTLPVVASETYDVAGGQRVTFDVALGKIHWMGQAMLVEILLSPGAEVLIGTQVFRGQRLEIDYDKRTVMVDFSP